MRVTIRAVEKSMGIMHRRNLHGIECLVEFSEEEKQIIDTRQLASNILLTREWSADVNPEKKETRSTASRLVTSLVNGHDANDPHLTIRKLLRGPETYYQNNVGDAKAYELELREALRMCKGWLETNTDPSDGGTYEL